MDQAKEFLSTLFAQATDNLCIASFANTPADKHPAREQCTREWSVIERFIKKHDVPGRAVYMCVSSVPTGKRTAQTVGVTFALHADLDFKNINATEIEIKAAVARLPLRPTLVIFSGHGLHLWWRLDTPCADHERMTRLQRLAADVLAADRAVCHVAAVMRVPDSHNTKNGENIPVEIIQRNDTTFSMEQLEEYFEYALPLLARIKNEKEEPRAPVKKLSAWEQYAFNANKIGHGEKSERIDHDVLWSQMVYFGENNGGNLHHTITRCLSSLLSRQYDPLSVDDAIEEVCRQIELHVPEASSVSWDWSREITKLRRSAVGWLAKKPEVLATKEPTAWLEKCDEIKTARAKIKAAEGTIHEEAAGKALNGSGKTNGHHPPPPKNNAPADPAIDLSDPMDLWAGSEPVGLPRGILPKVIEAAAFEQSKLKGTDAAGIAMGALGACATVIPNSVKLQPKVHDQWAESARFWPLMVGPVSAAKSSIFEDALREIDRIQADLSLKYKTEQAKWNAASTEEKKDMQKPLHTCIRLEDVLVEVLGEIAQDSPDGLVVARDEIAGLFGNTVKYSGKGGGQHADKAVWLQFYNGASLSVERMSRSVYVELFGGNIIGGTQPKTIRSIAEQGTNNGLIQRFNPVMVKPRVPFVDAPLSAEARSLDGLIATLYQMPRMMFGNIKFTDAAQKAFYRIDNEFIELTAVYEHRNTELAEHIGKWGRMFVRMCLIFHCIENQHASTKLDVELDVVERVYRFFMEFLLPHARVFYTETLKSANNMDTLLAVASFVLAHPDIPMINSRVIKHGTNSLGHLERHDIDAICGNLEAAGWVTRAAPLRMGDNVRWLVNPKVHDGRFEDRARQIMERNELYRNAINAGKARKRSDGSGDARDEA